MAYRVLRHLLDGGFDGWQANILGDLFGEGSEDVAGLLVVANCPRLE
jgi:hypothetical protein